MKLSARNQLRATVISVTPGAVNSEVLLAVGDQQLVSVITKAAVDSLGIKPGAEVIAVIKASSIMLGVD